MADLTIRVIHEWRPGHADPLAYIEKGIFLMTTIAERIGASVDNLAVALGNQTSAIGEVATAIRNHPASTTDNGALEALAVRLDNITASVNSSATELHSLAGEEDTEDAAGGAPTDNTPPDASPPVGSDVDAGNVGDGSTGEPSGDAFGSGGSSETTSGDTLTQSDVGSASDVLGADVDGAAAEVPAGGTASGDGFAHDENQ